jgi:hypothetical protein
MLWAPLRAEPIDFRALSIPFNPEAPDQRHAGRLTWLAGFELRSTADSFGGWSGLDLLPDGSLLAVSDLGWWMALGARRDGDGRLLSLGPAQVWPLLQPDGGASRSKRDNDAEALRRDRDGSWLVSFELRHRVQRYRPGANGLPDAAGPVTGPADLASQPLNGGIESLAVLGDGRLLLLSEEGRTPAGDLKGWLRGGDGQWSALAYRVTEPFRPVDAALLPDGDVLVLERRFSRIGGVGSRLVRIPAAAILPGAVLDGEEVAQLAPPVTVDNFEGLAVGQAPSGATLLYLIADDNRSPLQRTLLLQFRLD